MENRFFHIITALVLIALLVLLSDPFMLWMPAPAQMGVLLGVAVLAVMWAGFVVYERAHDEREAALKMRAGRVAYLSGICMLTLALIFQGLAHAIDPWISATLAVMVISKIIARIYSENH